MPPVSGVDDPTERDLAAVASALLDAGRRIDRLSRALTVASLIALLLLPAMPGTPPRLTLLSATVAIFGCVELYLAIRAGFDMALFRRLAISDEQFDCARLDLALLRLGLIPPAKTGRPMAERVAGACRLLFWQGLALGAQVLLTLIGAGFSLLPVWRGE
jgi:hypothetical protein